jgi:manganese/zinc/iron transport system permease protein
MTYLTWIVVIGTSLLGCVAGVLGSFAVLRRRALTGDLLSHAALPGLCLAFLVLGGRHFLGMLGGAFATGLAGVALVTLLCRWTRTKEDAALGIVLSTFFGAGIMLSSVIQNMPEGGAKAGLETYIYGQAAGMIREDIYLLAAVSVVVLLILLLFYKEFKVFSFDPGFAQAQGWPTLTLDMAMMGSLTLVTVVGLPSVGVVLMAAMLIIPGAAARFWTHRLERMLVLSGVLGALSGTLGSLISAGVVKAWLGFDPIGLEDANLPTGPVIVLCSTAVFLFSVLFAPQRGLIARAWSYFRLRAKTADENLLRTLFECTEQRTASPAAVSVNELLNRRAWSRARIAWLVRSASRRGLVRHLHDGVQLTAQGLAEARRLVRAHRLWELFLIHGASIAPDHVDRDADSIEHFLSPEIIEELEARFAASGRPGAEEAVPTSPHEIEQGTSSGFGVRSSGFGNRTDPSDRTDSSDLNREPPTPNPEP